MFMALRFARADVPRIGLGTMANASHFCRGINIVSRLEGIIGILTEVKLDGWRAYSCGVLILLPEGH